jgi:hypothetical protein
MWWSEGVEKKVRCVQCMRGRNKKRAAGDEPAAGVKGSVSLSRIALFPPLYGARARTNIGGK